MPPTGLFLLVGVSILTGFLANQIHRRWHVSDIIFLLLAGILIGPVGIGLADPALIAPAFAFLGPLGLVVVLFEGGLELAWRELRAHAPRAAVLTSLTWTLSATAAAVAAHYAFGLSWILAALLGLVLASTGILVVIPLLNTLRAPPEARVLLTVETAVGDLLSAVAVTSISAMLVLGASPGEGVRSLAFEFAVGAAVGFAAGIAWARALHRLNGSKGVFALTLAALMLAYIAAESIGGSGYLMALTFGLVVGNARILVDRAGVPSLATLRVEERAHQSELIFLLRSVYFVYLGMVVPASAFAPPLLAAGAFVVVLMFAARLLAVRLALVGRVAPKDDATPALLAAMMPRGLATALIAAIPVAMGVPGTEAFLTYTFLVILGCDVLTSVGVVAYARARSRAAKPAPAPGGPPFEATPGEP